MPPSKLLKKHNLAACVIHGLFFVAVIGFYVAYKLIKPSDPAHPEKDSRYEFFQNIFADVIPMYYSSEKWVEFDRQLGNDELLNSLNKSLTLKAKKGCAFPALEPTEPTATTLMFVLTLVYTFAACFHHFLCIDSYIFRLTDHYDTQLETGIVWWRYVEYAFSGSSMYVIILISAGYGDVHTLLLGFVAFALLQISGLCTDALLYPRKTDYTNDDDMIEFKRRISIIVIVIGFLCFGALMYLPIHTLADNWHSNMPVSIYALFTLEVTLFTGFGLVQLQRVFRQIGDDWWKDVVFITYNRIWMLTVLILCVVCFGIVIAEIHDRQSVKNYKEWYVAALSVSYAVFVGWGMYPIVRGKPTNEKVIVPTEERFIYLSLFSKTLLTIILKMFLLTVGNLRSKSDWTFVDTPLECFKKGH